MLSWFHGFRNNSQTLNVQFFLIQQEYLSKQSCGGVSLFRSWQCLAGYHCYHAIICNISFLTL